MDNVALASLALLVVFTVLYVMKRRARLNREDLD
jgi:hypothetical protein